MSALRAKNGGCKPTAIVFVDGLNLYRRALSGKPHLKWLDLGKLFQTLIPTHEIVAIKYFTARLSVQPSEHERLDRQVLYITALDWFTPNLSLHFGRMISSVRSYTLSPRQTNEQGQPITAKVKKIEEKGTDVALASHMVLDASQKQADLYVLVSSDTDFVPTLELLTQQLSASVALIFATDSLPKRFLGVNPLFIKPIRDELLQMCQLPAKLGDQHLFVRPDKWS